MKYNLVFSAVAEEECSGENGVSAPFASFACNRLRCSGRAYGDADGGG